ncbi:chromosome segregation 1-like protein [Gigaspora rosea]|uniref:Chromosome segregation 1-like protein n=1 Tax=Gigaspora rosea TaxID=44941 RepID=A0A397U464_9GLOM|nr:chromosome segregation 1-like protein [Gigaspora rosea]
MSVAGVNDQYLATLANLLKQTLEPTTRQLAESELFTAEAEQSNFPIAILQLITKENTEPSVRFAGSLLFKNYVKRNWVREDESKIPSEIRNAIKECIVDILVSVPTNIQLQLSEAVTLIAESDFPRDWQNLIQQLSSKLDPEDYARNNGVLQTAHSIFKRWRHQFRTDPLFAEINFVLEHFCTPFFQLLQNTDAKITEHAQNKQRLQVYMQTFLLLMKLFYDLNCQDIPPFFEDNMEQCMALLHKYIVYSNPLLESESEDEAGPLEKVKSSICEIVTLYTMKYEELFTMLPQFVETVWFLLTTIGIEAKYDLLVSKSMAFLSTVVKLEQYHKLFNSETALTQFCQKIVLPNMYLRNVDEELFEYDPIEFIRRDIEGSDSDTRRRAASDFVRSMMTHFMKDITRIIGTYITQFLKQYNENPSNWKDKDAAIYLLTSIATPGTATKHGLTVINDLVNVVDWFSENVLPDLQAPVDSGQPVLKVDAIKYLYTFRNQMSKPGLAAVFPLLVNHLSSTNYVVHTYAAIAIERILFMRKDNAMMFNKHDIKPYTQELLINLFRLIEAGTTPETLAENDYLMKAVMRVIFTSRDDMSPYVGEILNHLNKILGEISKNPSNPRFNHYVFESIGALVRFNCLDNPMALQNFENMLFGPFQIILQQDVVEFVPYVFQIFSQLLELHTEAQLPDIYKGMLPALLTPNLWESSGNIPALVRFLHAYLYRDSLAIIANKQLEPILGIFQKLIASKANDKYGLELLCSIVQYVHTGTLNQYIGAILSLLLRRLQSSRTEKFALGFVNFVCFFIAINLHGGPDYVVHAFDSIQEKLFLEVLNAFIIPDLQKIQGYTDRKVCAIAMIRLLTQSDLILSETYINTWPVILAALIKLFEAPTEIENYDAEEELLNFDFEEDRQFQTTFAKLTTASKPRIDPTASIPEPKVYLAQELHRLSQAYPNIAEMIQTRLPTECIHYLDQYMKLANPTQDNVSG